MIYIKSEKEIALIEQSSKIVAETLLFIEKLIEPGIDTLTLNKEIENFIVQKKARPAFKGLYGFPAASLTSINDEVVHGIPGRRKLADGDIVGVDIGVELNGYFGDAARTYLVGDVEGSVKHLCTITEQCLIRGIRQCKTGNRVGDISEAVQSHAEENGYSVVRELVGHGVGIKPHEDPQIPNYGRRGVGVKLKKGMVLAIEPMINMGSYHVYTADDGWTVKTTDGKPSAHYEHTVAIMADGPKILTSLN